MAGMTHHDHDSGHDIEEHDRGLGYDLATLNRRRMFGVFGVAGLAALTGCAATGGSSGSATTSSSAAATSGATATSSAAAGECTDVIPQETAGPYPGDGTNGPNVLAEQGIVRGDIRSSFGSASGTAEGVPLTIELTVTGADCAPLAGAAVYLWHCDRGGGYSMYSPGVTDQNYLRGVQEVPTDGKVTFSTIFPAAYSGRWPHAHFEVYASLADATGGGEPIRTSQLALPEDVCTAVYATSGYEASVRNLAQTSLARDMVFSDGSDDQLAAVTGSVAAGYQATLTVRAK